MDTSFVLIWQGEENQTEDQIIYPISHNVQLLPHVSTWEKWKLIFGFHSLTKVFPLLHSCSFIVEDLQECSLHSFLEP